MKKFILSSTLLLFIAMVSCNNPAGNQNAAGNTSAKRATGTTSQNNCDLFACGNNGNIDSLFPISVKDTFCYIIPVTSSTRPCDLVLHDPPSMFVIQFQNSPTGDTTCQINIQLATCSCTTCTPYTFFVSLMGDTNGFPQFYNGFNGSSFIILPITNVNQQRIRQCSKVQTTTMNVFCKNPPPYYMITPNIKKGIVVSYSIKYMGISPN